MNETTTRDTQATPSNGAHRVGHRRLVRIGLGVAFAGASIVALVGLLHLPAAAPLLRRLSPAAVCPVTRGTPEQIDRGHSMAAASIRAAATRDAVARPALVFTLDKTTKTDLERWATAHGVRCGSIGGNVNLQRCVNVAPSAVDQPATLGPLEEVTFEFRSTGELVNVQTLRRGLTAHVAAGVVRELEARLSAEIGGPTTLGGEPTAAHLAHGPLSTYVASHELRDYRATVSATNLARTGVMVREQYFSARL